MLLIFCYGLLHQGNAISTPAIEGTILPGITRKSIIEVAESKGYKVNVGHQKSTVDRKYYDMMLLVLYGLD